MNYLNSTLASIVAAGFLLAIPAESHAQYLNYYGNAVGPGTFRLSYYSGGYYPSYAYYGGYAPTIYSSYPYHGGYSFYPQTIVHPTAAHWTPYRGWHTHGHVHVPYYGGYYTVPY
jgi:hypothetical protein